jgi:dTDP-4-dehydrorhamnose 3,5-epimerase-like enzyme
MTIQDVRVIPSSVNPDHRGTLSTIFARGDPHHLSEMVQWNRVASHANVLRGVWPGLDSKSISLRDVIAAFFGSLVFLLILWLVRRSSATP